MANPNWVFARSFYAILFVVGVGSFLVHESAHWIAGVALGHDMVASPNHVSPRGPVPVDVRGLIAAAGPLITIAQGVLGFWLVRRRHSQPGFALLYMAVFMRALAAAVSLSNPNDEARVSQRLGLGTWTLPVAVVAGLSVLLVVASRELQLRFRDQFFCFWVASAAAAFVVGLDVTFWPRR